MKKYFIEKTKTNEFQIKRTFNCFFFQIVIPHFKEIYCPDGTGVYVKQIFSSKKDAKNYLLTLN